MPGSSGARAADAAFDRLVADAAAAPINGWDFSWLDGRAIEERPPWGYARMVGERFAGVSSALDVQTGGGEMLAGVGRWPPVMAATEPWPPFVATAAGRLRPLGIDVVAHDRPDLPFRDETFDLVICRHPTSTPWPAIARVLRPGATVLSQQIGGDNVEGLGERIRGPRPPGPKRGADRERAAAEASGLEVVDTRDASLHCEFYDIGAVVYFLRLVVWIVPGFDVERHRAALLALHRQIEADGSFVTRSHRFLIEARKPRS